jgi:hypothetical protein
MANALGMYIEEAVENTVHVDLIDDITVRTKTTIDEDGIQVRTVELG